MNVLNICVDDYANFMHDNTKALRSVGIEVDEMKLQKHVFNYNSESRVVGINEMKNTIAKHKIIQIFHSDSKLLPLCSKKRVIVYHTGTRYRQNSKRLNSYFNPRVSNSILALGEFVGMGAKNESYVVGAIDTNALFPIKRNRRIVTVGHYPSSVYNKGTETINKIIESIKDKCEFKYLHSTELVSYNKQIERMRAVDIYLELFSPTQGDKKYGSWGITAMEAAAMGKIVFTNHSTSEVYKKTYGCFPEMECHNDIERFTRKLQFIISNKTLIPHLQTLTRAWIVKHHSYKATGMKLKQILGL